MNWYERRRLSKKVNTECGFKVKCPTCKKPIWLPMDYFDGNFGEITGKCPNCLREASITIVICDKENLDKKIKEDE